MWLTGLVALLWSRRTRVLGLVFVAVAALLFASGSSRPNYLAVAYAPLLAAGGVAIERFAAARHAGWLQPAALAMVALAGAPAVPMGLPLLPVDRQVAYTGALSLRPRAQERTREGDLPQIFADMFGWEEMVQRVARVYHALPADQRATCAIFTRQLRRGRRHRLLRPPLRPATRHLGAQQLLALGPGRRDRRGRHHRRRQP